MAQRRNRAAVTIGIALVVLSTGLAVALGGLPEAGPAEPEALAERPEPRGEACVLDPEQMRREHDDLLTEAKRDGVRRGEATGELGIEGCVECHAAAEDHQAEEMAFCATCHEHTAVATDCFTCHSSTPEEPDAR